MNVKRSLNDVKQNKSYNINEKTIYVGFRCPKGLFNTLLLNRNKTKVIIKALNQMVKQSVKQDLTPVKQTVKQILTFLNEIKTTSFATQNKFELWMEILNRHVSMEELAELERVIHE